jgi:hypothetical protein
MALAREKAKAKALVKAFGEGVGEGSGDGVGDVGRRLSWHAGLEEENRTGIYESRVPV